MADIVNHPDMPTFHCQNGRRDVCLAANFGKLTIICPFDSCDIDDGVRCVHLRRSMSDSRKAIYDDENEYVSLCRRFGEMVQYKKWTTRGNEHSSPDCYGEHARKLKRRRQDEHQAASIAASEAWKEECERRKQAEDQIGLDFGASAAVTGDELGSERTEAFRLPAYVVHFTGGRPQAKAVHSAAADGYANGLVARS